MKHYLIIWKYRDKFIYEVMDKKPSKYDLNENLRFLKLPYNINDLKKFLRDSRRVFGRFEGK
jgi:hypothetical protein